jgi:hypothetical protein
VTKLEGLIADGWPISEVGLNRSVLDDLGGGLTNRESVTKTIQFYCKVLVRRKKAIKKSHQLIVSYLIVNAVFDAFKGALRVVPCKLSLTGSSLGVTMI